VATKYRFELPDGQTYESQVDPAALVDVYPDATITHVLELDDETGLVLSVAPAEDVELVQPEMGEPGPPPDAAEQET
jgi:hypothetical protein